MNKRLHHVRGTVDFYPPQSLLFRKIIEKAHRIFKIFGYEEIILPILENEDVFVRSVGESTDIVEKQMFKIEGKDIILRPEGTAQVVRFFIENSLWKEKEFHKFFYIGAMFRGERPQKGRLRQFHHIGGECLGSNHPYLDAEVISLAANILKECGVEEVEICVNSLGCEKDKEALRVYLSKALGKFKDSLCPVCKARLAKNPLRILDCKQRGCQEIVNKIEIKNYLCSSCRDHFQKVIHYLDMLNIEYRIMPNLVRGLDYYTNTVFEIISSKLGSQNACGAGGRYNSLVKSMGGPDIPAIGFALGLERILLLTSEKKEEDYPLIFVVYVSGEVFEQALEIVKMLREKGIPSEIDYREAKSLKSQLRYAQRLGTRYVLIVGEEELKKGFFTLKDMRESSQKRLKLDDILSIIKSAHNSDLQC